MLFAFAAFHALSGEGGPPGEAHGLGKLEAAGALRLRKHGVVAAEDAGYVDALGTGHAVAAAGAADFFLLPDALFHFFEDLEVLVGQVSGLRLGGDPAVFLHHFQRVHARQDDCHLRLVVEPAQAPFSRGPGPAAVLHGLSGAGGKGVDQLAPAQGLHDHDRDPSGSRSFETVHARLRDLVQVIVLDLAEVPVVVGQNLLEIVGVSVVGEADVADGA